MQIAGLGLGQEEKPVVSGSRTVTHSGPLGSHTSVFPSERSNGKIGRISGRLLHRRG